ncbi:putative toxin-antitoxin system toxin component, PIN family [Spirosoma sp.]|uniref:putative toxin-antitoxin system toxin component, PIN family n=1 Tax=Spirosoma sp. TaxID=1899569 RepID=UPI003B3AA0E3
MTIVVDTNCLLAAVPKKSQYRWLYDAILNEQVRLVVTTEIITEYEEQLELFYAPDYAEFILIALLNIPSLVRINPLSFYWLLIANDPDDNKFVDAAIAANAAYIITNDSHYRLLKDIPFPSVNCARLADFKPILDDFLSNQ